MVTLKDISKVTGYSITTVSKALNGYTDVNDDTREVIKRVSAKLGYVPNYQARGLVMKRSWTIGIVMDEISGLGVRHPLFSEVLDSFKKEVEKSGYDIMFLSLSVGDMTMNTYLEHARRKGVDGVFIIVTDFDSKQYKTISESEIPCVVFDHISANIYNFTTNNQKGIELAFNHLYELGHRKIAHIYGSSITLAGHNRMTTYKQALKNNNIEFKKEYLVDGDMFNFDGGYRAMDYILNLEDKPTGIICASDLQALGAIRRLKNSSYSCPEDFSIVGFDGTEMNQFASPRLTSVRQDTSRVGHEAADYLMKIISKEITNKAETIIIEPDLLLGESTRICN